MFLISYFFWSGWIQYQQNSTKKRDMHIAAAAAMCISLFSCVVIGRKSNRHELLFGLDQLTYIVVKIRQCRSDLCYCSHTRRTITKDYNIKHTHCWLCNALWSACIVTEQYTVMSNLVQCDESQSRWLETETQWRRVGRPKLSATSHSETKQATAL